MTDQDWQDEVCGDCGDPYRECVCGGASRREVRHLRGLLGRLEWPETLSGAGPWYVCPVCSNHCDQGHESDCWLAAELGRQ